MTISHGLETRAIFFFRIRMYVQHSTEGNTVLLIITFNFVCYADMKQNSQVV